MIYALRALITVVAAALAFAAPASADDSEYLRMVQDRLTFLTPQQLLSEANKVCQVTRSGLTSVDAVLTVQRDLAVSVAAAVDIVEAAVLTHGC